MTPSTIGTRLYFACLVCELRLIKHIIAQKVQIKLTLSIASILEKQDGHESERKYTFLVHYVVIDRLYLQSTI